MDCFVLILDFIFIAKICFLDSNLVTSYKSKNGVKRLKYFYKSLYPFTVANVSNFKSAFLNKRITIF